MLSNNLNTCCMQQSVHNLQLNLDSCQRSRTQIYAAQKTLHKQRNQHRLSEGEEEKAKTG